jgi:hypothetical protein
MKWQRQRLASGDVTKRKGSANLPAGLEWKAGDGHAVDSAAWARGHARLVTTVVGRAVAASGELNHETLTHKLRTI